jgi:hypothetical protein
VKGGQSMEFSLRLSDVADEEVRKAIAAPLVRFNESQAGPSGNRALVIELRDADGAIVGGLWGATAYGWLFTQLLVVPSNREARGWAASSCRWPRPRR